MKHQFINEFGTSVIRPPKIYEFRHNSVKRVTLYFFFITLLFVTPLIISITSMENFLFANFGVNIVDEGDKFSLDDTELFNAQTNDNFEVIEYLPSDCYLSGGEFHFTSSSVNTFSRTQRVDGRLETERLTILVNPSELFEIDKDVDYTIAYYQYYYVLYLKGYKFTMAYETNDEMNFSDFRLEKYNDVEVARIILNYALVGMVHANAWVINIVLFLVFALINIAFIFLVSFLARFLRFRDNNFPSYSEIVKILIYCSTIPCIVGFVLGFIGAYAVATVLYNCILPFIAVIVYWKNKSIIKGEMSNKEAKEGQYLL